MHRITVGRILKNGPKTPRKKGNKRSRFAKVDNFLCDLIRRVIYGFFRQNKSPTIENIFQKLKNDTEFPYSPRHLSRLVKNLGFKFRRLNKRNVIVESPRIIVWRYKFLKTISRMRSEGRKIYYLDETWYDTHDVAKRGWVDSSCNCVLDAPLARGKRVIILHAGSEDGWVPNGLLVSAKNIKDASADYHEDMTANLFEQWFRDQLLPNIEPRSVIVIDNASYHSRQAIKIPCQSTKKQDIITYMNNNSIPVPDPVPIKPVLLDIIRQKNIQKSYVVDNMAAEMEHLVLRLPPYHCLFNPIEQMWSSVKSYVRKINLTPTDSVSTVLHIREAVVSCERHWRQCVEHVKKLEKTYSNFDQENNDHDIVIRLGEDSSSEEDE